MKKLLSLCLVFMLLFSFMPHISDVLAENELDMKVKSSLLMDYNSGEILFEIMKWIVIPPMLVCLVVAMAIALFLILKLPGILLREFYEDEEIEAFKDKVKAIFKFNKNTNIQ